VFRPLFGAGEGDGIGVEPGALQPLVAVEEVLLARNEAAPERQQLRHLALELHSAPVAGEAKGAQHQHPVVTEVEQDLRRHLKSLPRLQECLSHLELAFVAPERPAVERLEIGIGRSRRRAHSGPA
jgi:hypothetical protein